MNALQRTLAQLDGGLTADRIPAHPLFMVYAADLIGAKYWRYLQDYHTLVRAQMALLERFPVDVVSCCSDAWREAADCGARLEWQDHAPPFASAPVIETAADLARLAMPNPTGGGRMTDRLEAIQAFVGRVKGEVPILGWIEGPVAEAVNLMGMDAFMTATLTDLEFARAVMDWCVELERRFALAQVAAGADIVGIGDAAASLVSPEFCAAEVASRERALVASIHAAGARARLHICGNVHGKFAAMASIGADLIDIDYPQTLAQARAAVGDGVCLAGNVHPVEVMLNGAPDQVRAAFAQCLREAGPRYFLAAGCEIPPGTPEANLRAMFDSADVSLSRWSNSHCVAGKNRGGA